MNDERASLDELGIRYATDKSSRGHNYLSFYERFFERFRDKPIKLLEIGVYGGASLEVWQEYFPNATIIGVDVDPSVPTFARSRVIIEILDQSNVEELVQLGMRHGPFDIIIDDGSHHWEHQITSLRTLFPFLRNGGIYVVEDLQTNYGSMAGQFRGVSSISCVDYIKRLVDLRVADTQIDILKEEDAFLRTYGRAMNFIAFYRTSCLLEKSYQQPVRRRTVVGQPLVAIDQDDAVAPLSLLAHFGVVGNRQSESGWLRGTRDNHNIQGFLIDHRSETKVDISYRARLSDRNWSDWVALGQFVGTRGKGQDLTGFTVRLGDMSREDFDIEAIGAFRGESGNVTVCGGEDCVSNSGAGQLFAMQVILRARSSSKSSGEHDFRQDSQASTTSMP